MHAYIYFGAPQERVEMPPKVHKTSVRFPGLDYNNYQLFLSVSDVLSGFNGTIFAYGQTSSGKTHTMEVSGSQMKKNVIKMSSKLETTLFQTISVPEKNHS